MGYIPKATPPTAAQIPGLLDRIYPVGSIFEWATYGASSVDLSTPEKVAAHFGGTWEAYGAGRMLVGVDTGDTDFSSAGKTGGEKKHTLTTNEMPAHSHAPKEGSRYVVVTNDTTDRGIAGSNIYNYTTHGGNNTTAQSGGGQPHNNMQPYVVVYRYRRIG